MRDPVELALELVEAQKTIAEQARIIRHKEQSISLICKDLEQANKRIAALQSQLAGGQIPVVTHESVIANPMETAAVLAVHLASSERKVNKLTEELGKKNKQIVELEEKLEEARRAGKRQANPFSRNKRKPKSQHKKPGRRKGRGPFVQRKTPEHADEEFTVLLGTCAHCGNTELPDEKKQFVNWQIDLPQIQPVITRFNTEGCTCPDCGCWTQSQHERQLSTAMGAANITFGPDLIAMAADMHEHLGISYEKLEDFLSCALNFKLERSSLCKAVDRLLKKAEPIYSQLIDLIRQSSVVHADETGWRIGILKAWMWTFTNTEVTVFEIREGEGARGHKVVLDILGTTFKGVLVSDCFIAYDVEAFDDWMKQKCIGHLLRAFADLRDDSKATELTFALDIITILKAAIKLDNKRAEFQKDEYDRQCIKIETDLDAVLEKHSTFKNDNARRLLNRLKKHRKHLFTFLYREDVPATNNQAESDLRPGVTTRKTQGCNKTHQGARKHVVITSISATLRKQGRSPIEFYRDLQLPNQSPSIIDPKVLPPSSTESNGRSERLQ